MYETKNVQAKIFLMRKDDFERMIAQLSIVGLSLKEKTQACLLLGSLLESWNTLVVSLGNSTPKGKVIWLW